MLKYTHSCTQTRNQVFFLSPFLFFQFVFLLVSNRRSMCVYSGTGWQRPIGCLKLQVIFRKRATNSKALLWKMTYKDKASYESTPPCSSLSAKEPLITGLFCGKWPIKIRHPMNLRHPVHKGECNIATSALRLHKGEYNIATSALHLHRGECNTCSALDIHTKESEMCICIHTQKRVQCVYVYTHKGECNVYMYCNTCSALHIHKGFGSAGKPRCCNTHYITQSWYDTHFNTNQKTLKSVTTHTT